MQALLLPPDHRGWSLDLFLHWKHCFIHSSSSYLHNSSLSPNVSLSKQVHTTPLLKGSINLCSTEERIIREGEGRGPCCLLLPKAGWNHPLDSGADPVLWKGSLKTMIKCGHAEFQGSLPFIQKSVLLYFYIPEPLKLQHKKKEQKERKEKRKKQRKEKPPLLRCMTGARWILLRGGN